MSSIATRTCLERVNSKIASRERNVFLTPRGPSQLERLPDELLSVIAEYCRENSHFITASKYEPILEDTRALHSSNTLYHLSKVNKRLRRIFLPWLFRSVCFKFFFQDSGRPDEIADTIHLLHQYIKFAKYIRFIYFATDGHSNDHRKMMLPLIFNVLKTCSLLQWITLPRFFAMSQWDDQVELLQVVNHHPSSGLRVVYPCARAFLPHPTAPVSLPDLDLSRVTLGPGAIDFRDRSLLSIVQTITERGVHVEEVTAYDDSIGSKPWRDLTYPGLRILHGWMVSESCQWPELRDFISRHPQLEEIQICGLTKENTRWLAEIPWARFVADLPDACTLNAMYVIRESGDWRVKYARVMLRHDEVKDEGKDKNGIELRPPEDLVIDKLTTTVSFNCHEKFLGLQAKPAPIYEIREEDEDTLWDLGRVLPVKLSSLNLLCQHPRMSTWMAQSNGTFRVDSRGRRVALDHVSDGTEITVSPSRCHLFAAERAAEVVRMLAGPWRSRA
ncbi:hypothetical protein VKT23_007523 [Stygiomarasmius scandens]|uniref:F-box domain-containing protein n=1 Tax=Marasmiellus scandens TaxID=2682957 RepID=A0ABR1JK32_9AGAR